MVYSKIREKFKKNKKEIDRNNLPEHIAIIMDGNGRWAKSRGLPRTAGHKAGVQALKRVLTAAKELDIKILTVYAFSTENWKRPRDEVDTLMNLLTTHLHKDLNELNKNGIKINFIGSCDELPIKTKEMIIKAEDITLNNRELILNVALNYGGRAEIITATKNIIKDVINDSLNLGEIDEETFSKYLFTSGQKDPDLLIRPSGEMRISNFLLWQIAYTEIYFTPVYWPDFKKEHLVEAILEYQKRERRFGGLKI